MPGRGGLAVLALGVVAVGWAAIFFRLADDAPALTIAAYRMVIAAAVMGVVWYISARPSTIRRPTREQSGWLLLSGIFLALHFWAWFASLERTSVASSVVIVTMQPLIGALFAFVLFAERPTQAEYTGLALATAGLVIIAGGDLLDEGVKFQGDLLAFAGAILTAAYLTTGRRLRTDFDALAYSTMVYTIASVVLCLFLIIVRPNLGPFGADTWLWIAMVALIPQVIGHTAINWALGHFRVVTVGLAILGEPVISALLAIPVLGEWPPPTAIAGGIFILAGVYIGLRHGTQPHTVAATAD